MRPYSNANTYNNVVRLPILVSIFILLLSFLLLTSNSFAACIKVNDADIEFLPTSGDCDKDADGTLSIYNNTNLSNIDPKAKNDLNSLIEGKNDGGYSIHFTFDREGEELSGEQTFFAAYDAAVGGSVVARAGIRSGEFFYETGSESINSLNMSAIGDSTVSGPHIAIIVYDTRRKKMIINIDGAEIITKNVEPIRVKNIGRIDLGSNYTGKMGLLTTYATKMSIQERMELVKILGVSVPSVKRIKPRIGASGVLESAIDKDSFTKCSDADKISVQGECIGDAVIPPNTITPFPYPTKTWNAAVAICSSNGLSLCSKEDFCPGGAKFNGVGFNRGDQWLPVSNGTDEWVQFGTSNTDARMCLLHSEYGSHNGDPHPCTGTGTYPDTVSCNQDQSVYCCSNVAVPAFTFGVAGNVALPANASGPAIAIYNTNLTSSNLGVITCGTGYEASTSPNLGYYFNGTNLAVQGSCEVLDDTKVTLCSDHAVSPSSTTNLSAHGSGICCTLPPGTHGNTTPNNNISSGKCPANDTISFVGVPSGCTATIYAGDPGSGTSMTLQTGGYNLDEWANNTISGIVIACSAPSITEVTRMRWPRDQVNSWDNADAHCKSFGARLCNRSEVCSSTTPINGSVLTDIAGMGYIGHDNWVPFNVSNEYLQLGALNGRKCKTHRENHGGTPVPCGGNQLTSYGTCWHSSILCCPN